MHDRRLTSWIDWYRFARRELDYSYAEAAAYANVRTVEDMNHRDLTARSAASTRPAPTLVADADRARSLQAVGREPRSRLEVRPADRHADHQRDRAELG